MGTMDEIPKELTQLRVEADRLIQKLGLDQVQVELTQLRTRMQQPDFWRDSERAAEMSQRESRLNKTLSSWLTLSKSIDELIELARLGDNDLDSDMETQINDLQSRLNELKQDLRFNGPYDDHAVILNIFAGGGGTDAQDWAQMLQRMYTRWAETHAFNVKIVDLSLGKEAGIKSVTLKITGGDFLYGKLKSEHGVHRLVRKSPFNSAGSRETSFARVDVLPEIVRPEELELDEADLKVETFRASGHGGQSVNTTDSAVRITHMPTGVSVSIQNERSQLQNKQQAMAILRSRLAQLQLEQHAKSLSDIKGPSQSAEFGGNQIRNYILDDRLIKDERSGYQTTNTQSVLDGDLDPLIDSLIETNTTG